ncbi:hypothetical protein BCR41DRAFT_363492 [Lobosporangium transversale]|uniref:Uncharacterized protein n=1 Tax=Lobosporangium transversale TaxID=64571 RepID=A0A1Y2G7S8_9FUNG|nr:hypothetical protein BCR41DRAFT_363492 [Lobosporangium transversale]ORZ01851.1 hypothetical protein BCR41DRAFT_363492 [Lobosporangium transversale]|eukprot:XP_021876148.1 hypothetical protein BCR41DRAFT_363492 [Lobosporangium transversale]
MATPFRMSTTYSLVPSPMDNLPCSQPNLRQKNPLRRDSKTIHISLPVAVAPLSSAQSPTGPTSSFSPLNSTHIHHESLIPSSLSRRSLSPINGAASVMKNFLRRRRGTISSSSPATSKQTDIVGHHQSTAYDTRHSSYELPTPQPSMNMHSFVVVGGYGAKPGTTVVLYDSEPALPSPISSPRLVQCESPVIPVAKSTMAPATTIPGTTTVPISTPSFSQAMMGHYSSKQDIPHKYQPRHGFLIENTSSGDVESSSIHSSKALSTASSARSSQLSAKTTGSFSCTTINRRTISMDSLQTLNTTTGLDPVGERQESDQGEGAASDIIFHDQSTVSQSCKSQFERSSATASPNNTDTMPDRNEASNDAECIEECKVNNSEMMNNLGFSNEVSRAFDDLGTSGNNFTSHFRTNQDLTTSKLRSQQQRKTLYHNSMSYLSGQLYNYYSNMPGIDDRSIFVSNNNSNNGNKDTQDQKKADQIEEPRPYTPDQISEAIDSPAIVDFQDTYLVAESIEQIILPSISSMVVNRVEGMQGSLTSGADSTLLVSNCSSPTQFYDAPQTRRALRMFLTSSDQEFDEMVQVGFPSKVFSDYDSDMAEAQSLLEPQKQDNERPSSDRYMTLRITLTPWHARADEVKLYGADVTHDKQTQFISRFNKFFSRSTATSSATSPPFSLPSSVSSFQHVRPAVASRTSSDQSVSTLRSSPYSEHGIRHTLSSESIPSQAKTCRFTPDNISLSPSIASSSRRSIADSIVSSRTNSRRCSADRDRDKVCFSPPPSVRAASRAAAAAAAAAIVASESTSPNHRLFSPPSTRSPSPLSCSDHSESHIQDGGNSDNTTTMTSSRKGSSLDQPLSEHEIGLDNSSDTQCSVDSEVSPFMASALTKPTISSASHAGQDRTVAVVSLSGDPSSSHLETAAQAQEPRRSTRYPYQQHAMHQEKKQYTTLPRTSSLRMNWSSSGSEDAYPQPIHSHMTLQPAGSSGSSQRISSRYAGPGSSRVNSSKTIHQDGQDQYRHSNAGAEISSSSSRHGPRFLNFSLRSKKNDKVSKAIDRQTLVPPHISAKSWRRGGHGDSGRKGQLVESERSVTVATYGHGCASSYDYQCHDDANRSEQNPEAYFEISMDDQSYGGYGRGQGNGYGCGREQRQRRGETERIRKDEDCYSSYG